MTLREYIFHNPHYLGNKLGFTKLNKWHSDQIHYLYRDNPGERGIQAHRNSFKTTALLIVAPIWKLLYFPDVTIMILREEMSNAQAVTMTISELYKTPTMRAIYEEFYGIKDFKLLRDTQKSIVLPTRGEQKKVEGNIDASGLKTSKTGRHYDIIQTDDIITINDRVSLAKRDMVASVIRELRNIVKEGGTIGHSGTPWHRADGWNLIPNIKRFPIGSVPIDSIMRDLPGAIKKFKAGTTRSLYSANYELKHISDGTRLFPETDNRAEWDIENFRPYAHIDCKYKGADTMALTLFFEYNNKLYGKGFLFTKNIADMYNEIVNILVMHHAKPLHIEDNSDKGLSAREFNRGDKESNRPPFPTISYHESTNKHIKIITYLYPEWKKIYWSHDTDPEYLNQIIDYEEGQEPDDAPDSASALLRAMNRGQENILDYYDQ